VDVRSDLLSRVETTLRNNWRSITAPSILVAVSGGPDSVALLDILARLKEPLDLRLGIAHVNYGLRGEDSAEDALFVRDLAASYSMSISVKELSPEESKDLSRGGIPDKARKIRFRFFDEIADRDGYKLVALGHHRDDQLETFFLHLFRGAGTDGLTGMATVTAGRYLRPLLSATRAQVFEYLDSRNLPFRVDRSNFDRKYLRSRLRQRFIDRKSVV
jgi:tRNA(Ile)-lysidine synthase